jgi:tripartite-type tricarboxylate transporter receptor subunit TctC
VPNAVGGGYDTESRLLQPLVARQLGIDIVVDNQPSAGGIVGARIIATARPDGTTLGIISAPGLLVASLTGLSAPNPARDFTVLGRIGRSWHVWAASPTSPVATLDRLFAVAATRPLIVGLNQVASSSFVSVTAAAALLGLQIEFVSGFAGTRGACLAAMQGDVDLVCYNFETFRGLLAAGDLRPLMQVSDAPIARDHILRDVPLLGSLEGVAARRAVVRGRDPAAAAAAASGIADVVSAGRLVVAPAGLPADFSSCLERAFEAVLTSRELRDSTRRALDPAGATESRASVENAARIVPSLIPDIQAALARLRA